MFETFESDSLTFSMRWLRCSCSFGGGGANMRSLSGTVRGLSGVLAGGTGGGWNSWVVSGEERDPGVA